MFAFHFMAIGPFLAEIYQIPYLTLKIQGQGCDENQPKSNQVIYWSGPISMPKMKKKSKKMFKSYCVNKNLWPVAAVYEPVQKT